MAKRKNKMSNNDMRRAMVMHETRIRYLEQFVSGFAGLFNKFIQYMGKEKEFLEIASKEVKVSLNELKSRELLDCLNVPSRIKILNVLSKKSLPALDISESVNVNLPTTLFHLNKLLKANIVSKDNNKIYHLNVNRFVLHV